MTLENTTCLKEHVYYLAPFVGLGAVGGLIRELNVKRFSWKDLFSRAVTGMFAGMLVGMYLKHSSYGLEMQYAITGIVGATAPELMKAAQHWIIHKLGGEDNDNTEESERDNRGLDADNTVSGADPDTGKDEHADSTEDSGETGSNETGD